MSDETNHELLSAYLDGELTPDERSRVEQLLAENAECRQVYEELRALRASLTSLPRQKLDENLGPRVIRLAEQSMLGKARPPAAAAAPREEAASIEPADADVARGGGLTAAERKSRAWRAIIYPVLAVAAAVAMMLNSPNEKAKHGRHVAQAPMKPAPPAAMSARPEQASEAESNAADEATDSSDLDSMSDHLRAEKDEKSVIDEELSGPAARPEISAEREVNDGPGNLAKANRAQMQQKSTWQSRVAGGSGRKADLGLPAATLVIDCKLAPTAVNNKAFDTLLARNHLVPWSAPEAKRKDLAYAKKSSEPEGYFYSKPSAKAGEAEEGRMAGDTSAPGEENGWSKSVVVELDARQLVAVLADLQTHPDQFLSVELPAGPADERGTDKRLDADRNGNHIYGRNGFAGPGEPAGASRPAGAGLPARANGPVAADGPAAAESSPALPAAVTDSTADALNPALPASDAGGPERLRVLFRLSAARGD